MTASSSCFASGLPRSVILGLPAAPLARPITVSFVLVSPSTDICAITHVSQHHHSCKTLNLVIEPASPHQVVHRHQSWQQSTTFLSPK